MENEEPKMYVKYRGDTPYKYYYGTNYMPLWCDDVGYDTPEQAIFAYRKEKEREWKNG